jgi:hypothetical protein
MCAMWGGKAVLMLTYARLCVRGGVWCWSRLCLPSSYTRLSYTHLLHASLTRLSYTPLTYVSAVLSYTPLC